MTDSTDKHKTVFCDFILFLFSCECFQSVIWNEYREPRRKTKRTAIERFRAAQKHFELLGRLNTDEPLYRENLALALRSIGEIEALRGNYELARQSLTRAQDLFGQLAAEYLQRAAYQLHHEACRQALQQLDMLTTAREKEDK